MPGAGHNNRIQYIWEEDSSGVPSFLGSTESFATAGDRKVFGTNTEISTLEGSNNAVRVFDPNSREAKELIEQAFEGSVTIEFEITNPYWLKAVLSDPSHIGTTASPSEFTIDGSGDSPLPYAMQVMVVTEDVGDSAGNNVERILEGVVIQNVTISVEVGGNGSISLEGAYADETLDPDIADADLEDQRATQERTITFAGAELQRPDGTTLELVQSLDLTINNNTDMIGELGTRKWVDYSPKVREADTSYSRFVHRSSNEGGADDLQRMYGDSAATSPCTTVTNQTTLTLKFADPESNNSYKIELAGAIGDSYSETGVGDPEADIEGELNDMAASVTASVAVGSTFR